MSLRMVGVSGGLMLVSLACASSLAEQRQASLEATRLHAERFPKHRERCLDVGAESHTDIVAFPAGRADRVYIYAANRGRAYLIRGDQAQLVWCGERLPPERRAAASAFRGNAALALSFPFRTVAGVLPVERGEMDIFQSFAGRLTAVFRYVEGRKAPPSTPLQPLSVAVTRSARPTSFEGFPFK